MGTVADPETYSGSILRWLADGYEQAQRIRIETGERLRAVIQGRDATFTPRGSLIAEDVEAETEAAWCDEHGEARTPDETLSAITKEETLGPVPILGRTYLRHWQEERELFKEMGIALKAHPAYPWIHRVKGVGSTLACKVLARFDATKAPYASSFWAYAGLGTVPGVLYSCALCGLERSYPPHYKVTGAHKKGGSGGACKGELMAQLGDAIRVAQPRSARGEKMPYDAYAKKVLYLVGSSFVKSGGPYEEHYRKHRARLEAERIGWPDGRKHLTALRITEKLFLSHLWEVWRKALGLPTPRPWIESIGGHDPSGHIDPWSMVKEE